MKKLILLLFLIFVNKVSLFSQIINNDSSFTVAKREQAKDLMRDYFIYNCINYGLKNNGASILEKDRSGKFYNAWLSYIPKKDLNLILDYAKSVGGDVSFSIKAEKQSLVGQCINGYKSEKLNSILNKIAKKWVFQEQKSRED